MKERSSSGVLLLILVIGLGIFSGINGTFSLFSKLFSIAAGVVVLGIAILVLVVLYFAFKQPKETKTQHDHQLMREGRMSLVELKNTGLKIKDAEIKHQLDAVCLEVEQILKNVQKQNDSASKIRQLLKNYLPALITIIKKYIVLEAGNQVDEQLHTNMMNYLRDFYSAMEKCNMFMFEDEKIDLSIEMKALLMACQKDGLISNAEFPEKQKEEVIELKL